MYIYIYIYAKREMRQINRKIMYPSLCFHQPFLEELNLEVDTVHESAEAVASSVLGMLSEFVE